MQDIGSLWALELFSYFGQWLWNAVNLFIILSVLSILYALIVTVVSFFRGNRWRDTERTIRRVIYEAIAYSSIGDALSSLLQTLGFAISSLIRLIALPFRLIASAIIRFILGPVERVLDKSEKLIDERSEAEFARMREQAEKGLQRRIRREVDRARKRQMKTEIERSKSELSIPDFRGIQPSTTSDEIAKELLLERQISKCVEGLQSRQLPNPSIKEVAAFLNVTNAQARRVRNEMHKRGHLIKHANGTMEFSGD